jgi:hypothetical protein
MVRRHARPLPADGVGKEGVALDTYLMQAVAVRVGHVAAVPDGVGQVLEQGPAAGDVQDLQATADGKCRDGLALGGLDQCRLDFVALVAGAPGLGMRSFSVSRRVHVRPAGEDDAVEAVEEDPGIAHRQPLYRDQHRKTARMLDRAHVASR